MKLFLLFPSMIACTVIANLLMKLGAGDAPSPWMLGILSWRTCAGLMAFASSAIFYSEILKVSSLNIAQSYAAVQFIAVVLASALWLGEPIPGLRWGGIALITIGIVVIAISDESAR